jgi:glycosyltransferase involved in cell wall biosynthesis
MPITILHAAETIKGGIATVLNQLTEAQAREFDAANVRCLVPDTQADQLHAPKGVGVVTYGRTGRNVASLLKFGLAFVREVARQRPDVVHLHSSFAGAIGRVALVLLWPLHRPAVVYTPHAWAFVMRGSHRTKQVYALVEKLLLPFTKAINCGSDFERDEAVVYGVMSPKVRVIRNGVAVQGAGKGKSPFPAKDGVTRLLFVGRFDKQKGFDVALEAMRLLEGKDFHMTAVGEAVHGREAPPPRANITYAGWLKPDALAAYFAHADVLVMPSRWESFGLVAAEAASHGLAVVASRCCSLPEIIEDGKTGLLFTVDDAKELAELLEQTPAKRWAEMGAAARKHQQEHFNVSVMVAQVEAMYRDALQGKRG